jgi:hypothetical protein
LRKRHIATAVERREPTGDSRGKLGHRDHRAAVKRGDATRDPHIGDKHRKRKLRSRYLAKTVEPADAVGNVDRKS